MRERELISEMGVSSWYDVVPTMLARESAFSKDDVVVL